MAEQLLRTICGRPSGASPTSRSTMLEDRALVDTVDDVIKIQLTLTRLQTI